MPSENATARIVAGLWIVALLASSTPSSCALKSFHSAELIERHASAMGSCALPCDSRVGDRVTS